MYLFIWLNLNLPPCYFFLFLQQWTVIVCYFMGSLWWDVEGSYFSCPSSALGRPCVPRCLGVGFPNSSVPPSTRNQTLGSLRLEKVFCLFSSSIQLFFPVQDSWLGRGVSCPSHCGIWLLLLSLPQQHYTYAWALGVEWFPAHSPEVYSFYFACEKSLESGQIFTKEHALRSPGLYPRLYPQSFLWTPGRDQWTRTDKLMTQKFLYTLNCQGSPHSALRFC